MEDFELRKVPKCKSDRSKRRIKNRSTYLMISFSIKRSKKDIKFLESQESLYFCRGVECICSMGVENTKPRGRDRTLLLLVTCSYPVYMIQY